MRVYNVSYQIDAASMADATVLARDLEVFRRANVTVGVAPCVLRSGMRWSTSVGDPVRVVGWRDAMIAFDGSGSGRGMVAVFDGERDATCVVPPAQLAELIRGLAAFPLDLMDAMAAADYRRRHGGGGHGG